MLKYKNISLLNKHCNYLTKKLKNDNIFLVGGCIRDILLGINKDPKDVDFTMSGNPKTIYENIDTTNISHFMTEKFGTITLIPKKQKSDDKLQYELTPLREENTYIDNRHPEEIIWTNSIISDAIRRDFTINCMYYFYKKRGNNTKNIKTEKNLKKNNINDSIDLKFLEKEGFFYIANENLFVIQNHDLIKGIFDKGIFNEKKILLLCERRNNLIENNNLKFDIIGELKVIQIIIDPFLGLQDLYFGKLKCVGNAEKRFQEDALRIIRALRIPNVINQKLLNKKNIDKIQFIDYDTKTWISLKKNFFLVKFISKERIKDEIIKVFSKGNPFNFVSLLDEINLLKLIFPGLYATKCIEQPVRYHPFDVYTHTMLSLFELQKINSDYLTRLGMLYHDVGKVDQYYMYKLPLDVDEIRGLFGTHLNHQIGGIDIAKKDFENLKFSKKEIETIGRYISMHHKPGEILDAKTNNRIKKLRKILSEAGYEKTKNVIDICIGDRRGQYNPMQNNSDISDVFELKKLLDKLENEEGQFTIKNLAVDGNDLIKDFNMKADKNLGILLNKILDRVMNDIKQRNNKKTIYEYLKEIIKK